MTKTTLKLTTSIPDPLEQFEVLQFKCMFSTSLLLLGLFVCFLVVFFLRIDAVSSKYSNTKPNLALFRDKTFEFIDRLLKENLNVRIVIFFPVVYLTFLFLVLGNLLGMLPYSLTATSSAAITFFFSITFFVGVTLVGYGAHGDGLFRILLPAGVPLALAPFLIIVEALSYIARVVSLAVRLFANMLSGHGLLKVLGSFVWVIILHAGGPVAFYVFPVAMVFAVAFLELAVAVLQAYVFIVLICVYLNDAIVLH
jgi:ATP synthase subunit 6